MRSLFVLGTEGSLSLLDLRVGRLIGGEKRRQLRRKNGVEMAESKSGKLILYSVFDRKPVRFKEMRLSDEAVTTGFFKD